MSSQRFFPFFFLLAESSFFSLAPLFQYRREGPFPGFFLSLLAAIRGAAFSACPHFLCRPIDRNAPSPFPRIHRRRSLSQTSLSRCRTEEMVHYPPLLPSFFPLPGPGLRASPAPRIRAVFFFPFVFSRVSTAATLQRAKM